MTNVVYFRSLPDPLGVVLWYRKLEFVEVSARPEQHCHSEKVAHTGVGISIELWATHRHTDRSFVPFSRIYPREVVRLTGGLPRK